MEYTCSSCHDVIVSSVAPMCRTCSKAFHLGAVKARVEARLNGLSLLQNSIKLGEAYKGEIRAYQDVLRMLDGD